MRPISVEEQARCHTHFVSLDRTKWLDLEEPDSWKKAAGEYQIVYTRRLKHNAPNFRETIQTFRPTQDKMIRITTDIPSEDNPVYGFVKGVFDRGNLGAGIVDFGPKQFSLELSAQIDYNRRKTQLGVANTSHSQESVPGRFGLILDMGIRAEGSEIGFGVTEVCQETEDISEQMMIADKEEYGGNAKKYWETTRYGFQIVALHLACFDQNGEEDMQLVVGVKVPGGEKGVGSAFILQQELSGLENLKTTERWDEEQSIRKAVKRSLAHASRGPVKKQRLGSH